MWAFSHRVWRDISQKAEPLGLHEPVYDEFYPYDADPSLPADWTNRQAFERHLARWKERMSGYGDITRGSSVPPRVRDYFASLGSLRAGEPGVTTVIEVCAPAGKHAGEGLNFACRWTSSRWSLTCGTACCTSPSPCCAGWWPTSW